MYPVLDVATQNRLKRLDRRLFVRPCQNRQAGRYDIAYKDATGVELVALGNIGEFHDGVFRQLLQCMPWRFNQAFGRFVADNVDRHNDRIDETSKAKLAREASEKMWDDLQFIEQHGGKSDMVKGFIEDEMKQRER